MEAYLERPWAVRARLEHNHRSSAPSASRADSVTSGEAHQAALGWWSSLVGAAQPPNRAFSVRISALERQFRASLVGFTPLVDQWVLRIICATHPPLATALWPLVLARARGICLTAQQPNEPPQPSATPSSRGTTSPSPEQQATEDEAMMVYKPLDRPNMAFKGPRLFFEMEDSDPVAESALCELGQVLDLVEAMRFPLLQAPYERFRATMEFLFDVITRPEGKAQRQKTADLVMRSSGVIAFFFSADPGLTTRAMSDVYQGSLERAVGAIARINYYNPGAVLVNWLKEALQTGATTNSQVAQLKAALDKIDQEQVNIPSRKFEETYRTLCLNQFAGRSLRDDVLRRLDAGETDPMFIYLVLSVAYENSDRFELFADAIGKWKMKMFIRNNERVDAFLKAAGLIQATKRE